MYKYVYTTCGRGPPPHGLDLTDAGGDDAAVGALQRRVVVVGDERLFLWCWLVGVGGWGVWVCYYFHG